uniref:Uncharacterized protein n=1 Tax=Strongyloides stercoralis TaxID=6248 RepID=A0AAF5D5N9_STRER
MKISSKDTTSTKGTPRFYESPYNYFIYELNSFIYKRLIAEKNDTNIKDEIISFVCRLSKEISFNNFTTFDTCTLSFPTRRELSYSQLLEERAFPMYFTANEEEMLLSFPTEEFKTWFRNEIVTILDLIELYKKNSMDYIVPKVINDLTRCPVITIDLGKSKLESELHSCYRRVVLLYSLITTDVMDNLNKRQGLFKELNFTKGLLEVIIFSMDAISVRYNYWISEILYKNFPNISLSFGAGSSKRLRDIVLEPESNFASLGNIVSNSLINTL